VALMRRHVIGVTLNFFIIALYTRETRHDMMDPSEALNML